MKKENTLFLNYLKVKHLVKKKKKIYFWKIVFLIIKIHKNRFFLSSYKNFVEINQTKLTSLTGKKNKEAI